MVGAGCLATVALMLAAALMPALRASRPRLAPERPRQGAAAGFFARARLSPACASGVRMALESGRGRNAVPVRATLLAAVVGVAAVGATLTVTASADHLLGTPLVYGHDWDAVIGNGTGAKYSEQLVARLRSDRSIAKLAGGTVYEAHIDGKPTGVIALDAIRGSLFPTVLEGRAPSAHDEILVGTNPARALETEIGDQVEGRIGDRASTFRVVGRAVLPEVGTSGAAPLALGEGVAVSFEGLRRLNSQVDRNILFLGLAAGVERDATLKRLERERGRGPAAAPRRRR